MHFYVFCGRSFDQKADGRGGGGGGGVSVAYFRTACTSFSRITNPVFNVHCFPFVPKEKSESDGHIVKIILVD